MSRLAKIRKINKRGGPLISDTRVLGRGGDSPFFQLCDFTIESRCPPPPKGGQTMGLTPSWGGSGVPPPMYKNTT